jgi:hypothetical protein
MRREFGGYMLLRVEGREERAAKARCFLPIGLVTTTARFLGEFTPPGCKSPAKRHT